MMINIGKKLESIHEGMEFRDDVFFGDTNVHVYEMHVYDGFAVGKKVDDEDEKAPQKIFVVYPTKNEIHIEDYADCMDYRGLDLYGYDLDNIDANREELMDAETICLAMGRIVDWEFVATIYDNI